MCQYCVHSYWTVILIYLPKSLCFTHPRFVVSHAVLFSDLDMEDAMNSGIGGVRCAIGSANQVSEKRGVRERVRDVLVTGAISEMYIGGRNQSLIWVVVCLFSLVPR